MDKTKPDLQIRCITQNYFLISQPKHMLWVLKRTVSTNWIGYQRLMLKPIDKTKPGLKITTCNQISFSYFSTKTYVVDTQKNRLIETVILSTQKLCKS